MSELIRQRLAGACAIAGGLLRIAAAFAPGHVPEGWTQPLYLATDILMTFGLLGVYARWRDDLGWSGFAGFVLSIVGVMIVRTYGGEAQGYAIGAALWSIGMLLIGGSNLFGGGMPKLASWLWVGSFVVGALGVVVRDRTNSLVIAGVAFGAAFVVAGLGLMRDDASPEAAEDGPTLH